MSFPSYSNPLTKADLRENFTLFTEEFKLLKRFRQDSTHLGFAVLFKSFKYLGYPQRDKTDIPIKIISHIAGQLGLPVEMTT
jgi:hypothetical protein